ncbi:MAG: BolA/IbaG family iron-sulfur metabolism protein [Steroidobacteraceae bacterium]
MHPDAVANLIRQAMPGAEVEVRSEDQTHFAALVVAGEFKGKRPLARHQLVYAALGELVGREIHALSIDAFTPAEWAERREQMLRG